MFSPNSFTMSDWARLREIIAVLARHGLGEFMVRIKLSTRRRLGRTRNIGQEQLYFTTPQRVRMAFEELGPTFIKLGQILSTRVDIFGEEWTEELAQLQSQIPTTPHGDIYQQLATQLGQPAEQIFQSVDPLPIGSASIAEVYRAVLHTGQTVAIKIKRAGIEEHIAADLRILKHLAALIESELPELRRFCPVQMVQYFSRSLARETDLSLERRAIQRFADLYRHQTDIHIPTTYPLYSNRQILVQEYINDVLLKNINLNTYSASQRRQLAISLTNTILMMILQYGFFHADPHPGNILISPTGRITLIDFGLTGQISHQRQQEILTLIHALLHRDAQSLQYILENWAEGEVSNEQSLGEDVINMMTDYEHLNSADIRLSQIIADITHIIRTHHLTLPPDLVMLFKCLITLDGVIKQLDGTFQLLHHSRPLIRKIMRRQLQPHNLWKRSQNQARLFNQCLNELPTSLLRLNQRMRQGKLALNLDIQRLDQINNQLDKVTNRLTMGIVTAALIIGSSIVMSIQTGPQVFGLSFLGLIGYLLAFANSLWIIWSIWRSGRH